MADDELDPLYVAARARGLQLERRRFNEHAWWMTPEAARRLAKELESRADESERTNVPVVGLSVNTLNGYTVPRYQYHAGRQESS